MQPRTRTAVLCVALLGLAVPAALAAEPDPHASHPPLKRATRSYVEMQLPQISLVREDGKPVTLAEELSDGRPVVLNFIFTTCAGICPLMSQVFSGLERQLGPERSKYHLVSVSIDPEQDTPPRLVSYAKRFNAQGNWNFYTGTTEASEAVQRAFGTWRGDKMSHTPVTFLRASKGGKWVRIDGFASPEELAREARSLGAPR
jgi:protein SCO1/2